VAEGEDKPAKYPTVVMAADLVLLTKVDLAPGLGFDWRAFEAHLRQVRPDVPLLEVSARDGTGLAQWVDYLTAAVSAKGRALANGEH
jgi:hydrogenase nickel incorporation protein HypB